MLNKVIVSSGPTLPFVLLLFLKPVSSCVTPNSGEVWKMEEGNHAKWTYSPACRKITGGWTIRHWLLPTELQISHLHKQKVTRNLTKEQQQGRDHVKETHTASVSSLQRNTFSTRADKTSLFYLVPASGAVDNPAACVTSAAGWRRGWNASSTSLLPTLAQR